MKSISDPTTLANLIERLQALHPDTPRQWGTLTPSEMLCHLGDAASSVIDRATPQGGDDPEAARRRPILKWIALRAPLRWPRGLETPPSVDPRAEGTQPTDFEADRKRAIEGLRALATARRLAASHGAFGRMMIDDWHRWAYRHTDHHLRQFGL